MIAAAKQGDRAAFETLISRYEKKVYNLALRYSGNTEDAADLAQEALIKVYLSLPEFRGASQFGTWVHRIAANVCLDELRRRRRQTTTSLDEVVETQEGDFDQQVADPADGPLETVERRELRAAIHAGIASLDEEYRMAIILRDVQGHSYEEIAEIMGCALGTVKSRIKRGREKLAQRLAQATGRELFASPFVKLAERGESR